MWSFDPPRWIRDGLGSRQTTKRCFGCRSTCWPAPESTDNMNTKRVGRLGLLDAEEDALVSFMQTLTDGFTFLDQR